MSDLAQALELRVAFVEHAVRSTLHRRGAVVQVSGGIDSAVTLHLCVRAVGSDSVIPLFMPDRCTEPVSQRYAELAASSAGCTLKVQSIAPMWDSSVDRYAIASLVTKYFSDFDEASDAYSVNFDKAASMRLGTACFALHTGKRHGQSERSVLLRGDDVRRLLSTQNIKQRLRMTLAYAEADARNFAVVGASNADEMDLGFVVKYGDDAADVYALADLDKQGVRLLAEQLGIPPEIRTRVPTTDTFGLKQSQEDYFFGVGPELLRRLLSVKTVGEAEDTCRGLQLDAREARALWGIARSLSWTVMYNSSHLKMHHV